LLVSKWVFELTKEQDTLPLGLGDELARSCDCSIEFDLTVPTIMNMTVTSTWHPFDVEGLPPVHKILLTLDRQLGGIVQINGSPRDWWLPFRKDLWERGQSS
jgi:hypothetical protein